MMMISKKIRLVVNDANYELEVKSNDTLLHVLREQLGLKGTKEGCGSGDCGACSVIIDGKVVNSCLYLALEADGKTVLTVEGLSRNNELHPLQQAFIEEGAIQCGFCTPGMLMSAKALLDENEAPSEDDIRQGLAGNLCRCTGYNRIVNAVSKAANVTD